ncbi:hypothetical protein HK099_005855 [Clydaea vesicula]|uniref:RING-type domain-containing protein n=1 Tax=Clydaea vesicula TaxID=447962 RepID=A0AAD5U1V5_9FUNG|nr:hypothetical protein HK099_005855 [Clydaea vesicula]KAJ3382442.1 hypothetical protein HDU92_004771 [Lobulomyces angularis]
MSRHSKNNTALGHFTAYEKSITNYGTQKQRLGRDSMRNFDACCLCLQRALIPVCCLKGHLFCKECIYSNLLNQKQNFLKEEITYKKQEKSFQIEEELSKNRLKEEELLKFEETQNKFFYTDKTSEKFKKNKDYKQSEEEKQDEEERKRYNDEQRKKLQRDPNSKELPSFWVPTETPESKQTVLKEPKNQQCKCTGGDEEHPISIKKLVSINFTESKLKNVETNVKDYICPSCVKTFINGMDIVVTKTCGHTLCKKCSDKFVKRFKKCFVCDVKVKEKGLIDLVCEGTGFSVKGKAEAEKYGLPFQ